MKASIKKIIEIQSNFPKLTFQNKGYQYLSKEIKENHKKEKLKGINHELQRMWRRIYAFAEQRP